jgi:hypothetical protein
MGLTIVVVKHIGIAVAEHSLPAWSVGVSIRAVDQFTPAFDEICA